MQQSENAVKAPSRETELATAPIGRLMAKMAVPCITAQIINALYNIVDRIYVGRIEGVGKTALAGLGVAFPLIMVISAFAYLIGQGGAPLASIKMGAGKKEEAEKILSKCFGLMVIVSAVLMVVIYIVKTPLLVAFGASDATLPYAEEYLSIYLIGTVFVQISLGMNFFVTAQGFTSVSMKTTVIGAVINIILDPVFIFGFHMGVAGAAIATVIAQAASAVWVLFFLFGKKTTLRLRFADMRPQWKVLGPVLGLGLSPFIMNVTESAIQVVFTAGMQQYGGDDYVSVVSVLVTCITVIMMPMTGMCQGAQPITSYNYGAGNTDRVRATFRRLITCNGIYCLAVWGLIQLFPTVVIRLFSDDMSLMDIGAPRGADLPLRRHHDVRAERLPADLYGAGAGKGVDVLRAAPEGHPADPAGAPSAGALPKHRHPPRHRRHLPGRADRRYPRVGHHNHYILLPVPETPGGN